MIQIRHDRFAALATGGVPAVVRGLQDALRLEFATIPLYLYAEWSLDRIKNRVIATIIRSIVIEEMLHMTLMCNILNALGQSPLIDHPDVVPGYPGPLPGGVESDLTVHLEPFSMAQLAVFLKIEEPEVVLNFPARALVAGAPVTIGQFYAELRRQLGALTDSDFASTPRNQVDANIIENALPVTGVQSAQAAIDLIIRQGEGTSVSPLEEPDGDPAHYYRFNQIAKHAKLRKNPAAVPDTPPDQQYIYDGDPVPFDTTGVAGAPLDPKAENYAAGSAAREAMDGFNGAYRDLLKILQKGVNGDLDALNDAVFLNMGELGVLGRRLMATTPAEGGPLGPSFEYVP